MGSKSYEARAKKFDTKVPGATPFQDKLKEYDLNAPTVGMFGEISKDGESILEIAAWKRADEYFTFFASKPQVALSRIKQQMHREVGKKQHAPNRAEHPGQAKLSNKAPLQGPLGPCLSPITSGSSVVGLEVSSGAQNPVVAFILTQPSTGFAAVCCSDM